MRILLLAALAAALPIQLQAARSAQAAAAAEGPGVSAPAADPVYQACGDLVLDGHVRISLPAHPQVATHITFPGPIADSSNAAPELWDVFTAPTGGRSLWVRPRTTTIAGTTVGVTAVGTDGRPYDFAFEVSREVPDTSCWTITDHRPVAAAAVRLDALDAEREALVAERRRLEIQIEDQRRRMDALDQARQREIEALSATAAEQARDAIDAFRYAVNTAYGWGYSQTPPPFEISAAYDDGRNTYIRILSDAFGAPAVVGIRGEEVQALNYSYDDLTGVYEIQGLHEVIELRFADVLARVERKS